MRPSIALLLASPILIASCREKVSPGEARSTPLMVTARGCADVVGDGVCLVRDDTELVVWFKPPAGAQITATQDGQVLTATRSAPVRDGQRMVFKPQPRTSTFELVAKSANELARWSLSLAPSVRLEVIEEALRLRNEGKLEEAKKVIAPLFETNDPAVRARATATLARIRSRSGEIDDSIRTFREAIELDGAAQLISAEANDRCALSYLLRSKGAFEEARTALEPIRELSRVYGEASARLPYYEAQLAEESGDLREALELQRRSLEETEKLDMEVERLDTIEIHIHLLHSLGRFIEASPQIAELARNIPREPPCKRAEVMNNIGWSRFVESQAGAGSPDLDPIALLREAERAFAETCPTPREHSIALVSLASAELENGLFSEAKRHLEAAEQLDRDAPLSDALDRHRLTAELDLRAGAPDRALVSFLRLAELARTEDNFVHLWRAAVGRGRAMLALKRQEDALRAFREAESILDDRLSVVPLGEGRNTSAATLRESAVDLIDLLLRMGRSKDAAEAARTSRRRLLEAMEWTSRVSRLSPEKRAAWYGALTAYRKERRQLEDDATEDWKLPTKELERATKTRQSKHKRLSDAFDFALATLASADPLRGEHTFSPPAPGDLELLFHPVLGGWAVFASTSQSVRAIRLGALPKSDDPQELAAKILEPLSREIEASERVHILAGGALSNVDFHALPFRGDALLAFRPVLYRADLPVTRSSTVPEDSVPRALVVGGTSARLPGAAHEVQEVSSALQQSAHATMILTGVDASYGNVRVALEGTRIALFHFAGHAEYSGLDGQDSRLILAEDTRFSVLDILSLSHAPKTVILSACETVKSDGSVDQETLGIAQAFLLSGASQVIAAVRKVDDAASLTLFRTVFSEHLSLTDRELATRFRNAQLEEKKKGSGSAWADFRVMVR